jgi:hypothetical protein
MSIRDSRIVTIIALLWASALAQIAIIIILVLIVVGAIGCSSAPVATKTGPLYDAVPFARYAKEVPQDTVDGIFISGMNTPLAKANLGPKFSIHPASKGARDFIKDASLGYSEESGYIRVAGQWYKASWDFSEKKVHFIRTVSP